MNEISLRYFDPTKYYSNSYIQKVLNIHNDMVGLYHASQTWKSNKIKLKLKEYDVSDDFKSLGKKFEYNPKRCILTIDGKDAVRSSFKSSIVNHDYQNWNNIFQTIRFYSTYDSNILNLDIVFRRQSSYGSLFGCKLDYKVKNEKITDNVDIKEVSVSHPMMKWLNDHDLTIDKMTENDKIIFDMEYPLYSER